MLPAAQLGEPWALRKIFDTLAPQVHGYLRVRGADEPDELTSDVFLTVFGKLPNLTGGASGLRTFTFSVAHARLVDALRKQSRRPDEVSYDPARDDRRTDSAEDAAADSAATRDAARMLARLPEDQRTVLALRVIGELSLQEVADAIGRSTGAVKQLQRRALITLKSELTVHA